MSSNANLIARLNAEAAKAGTSTELQAALQGLKVVYTAGANTRSIALKTIYINDRVSDADLLSFFAHELQHIKDGTPLAWGVALRTANLPAAIDVRVWLEARAIGAQFTAHPNFLEGTFVGYGLTAQTVLNASMAAMQEFPPTSPEYRAKLAALLFKAIKASPEGMSYLSGQVRAQFIDYHKGKTAVRQNPQGIGVESPAEPMLAVHMDTQLSSLGDFSYLEVMVGPDGKTYIRVTREDGSEDWATVTDDFAPLVHPMVGPPQWPDWYNYVPMSSPAPDLVEPLALAPAFQSKLDIAPVAPRIERFASVIIEQLARESWTKASDTISLPHNLEDKGLSANSWLTL